MTASKFEKERENGETAKEFDGVIADKIRFAVYLFPETMKTINSLYKGDSCSWVMFLSSRSFLMMDPVTYLSMAITSLIKWYHYQSRKSIHASLKRPVGDDLRSRSETN